MIEGRSSLLPWLATAALVATLAQGCGNLLGIDDLPADRDTRDDSNADAEAPLANDDAAAPSPLDRDAAATTVDASVAVDGDADECVAACTNRSCGLDPVCGTSCGTCGLRQACDATAAGVACRSATIEIEVDGTPIYAKATQEVFTSQGNTTLFFPSQGRNAQLYLPTTLTPGSYACHAASTHGSYTTRDNSYSELDAVPAKWRDLTFVQCGVTTAGDNVLSIDLTVTASGPTRLAGSYELTVLGGGPREGSTLRIFGQFDVTP